MRFIPGPWGAAASVSIVLACTHGRSTAISMAPSARPVAAAAVLFVGADGALTLDARRMNEADLDRALRMDALDSPGRAVIIAGAPEARYGGVLRALELAGLAAAGPTTLAAPDLHPLTAFPAPTGEAGASYARVAIDADGRVWLDQSPVGDDDLAARARLLLAARRPLTIVVAADRRTLYGRVSAVIDVLRRAGVTDFLIASSAPEAPPPATDAPPPAPASVAARPPETAPPSAPNVVMRDVDLGERPRIECDEEALRNFFPQAAAERDVSGMRVQLRVSVDAGGAIVNAQAMEDPGFGLGSAAERAVMTGCRASVPRDRAGRPVATVTTFRLNFELEGPPSGPAPAPAPWGTPAASPQDRPRH